MPEKKSDYDQLILTFKKLGGYKDSEDFIKECVKKRKIARINFFLNNVSYDFEEVFLYLVIVLFSLISFIVIWSQ